MRSFQSFFSKILQSARGDPETLVAALQGLWPHLVGEEIAAHSRPVGLRGSTLVVDVASREWVEELTRLEPLLLERTNGFWESSVMDRIEFRSRVNE